MREVNSDEMIPLTLSGDQRSAKKEKIKRGMTQEKGQKGMF